MILRGVLNKSKALQPVSRRAATGFFVFIPSESKLSSVCKQKSPVAVATRLFLCSGGRIRTCDLWVMSPTSYHCSTPQYYCGCKFSINAGITKRNIHFLRKPEAGSRKCEELLLMYYYFGLRTSCFRLFFGF